MNVTSNCLGNISRLWVGSRSLHGQVIYFKYSEIFKGFSYYNKFLYLKSLLRFLSPMVTLFSDLVG